MNFLDYKDELEKFGYTVTEKGVTTRLGDVLAAHDSYGSWWCVDSRVQDILNKPAPKPIVEKIVAPVKKVIKRRTKKTEK